MDFWQPFKKPVEEMLDAFALRHTCENIDGIDAEWQSMYMEREPFQDLRTEWACVGIKFYGAFRRLWKVVAYTARVLLKRKRPFTDGLRRPARHGRKYYAEMYGKGDYNAQRPEF